jgi:hypothetical protein
MIYIKEIPSQKFEDALALSDERAKKIRDCIAASYHQSWHKDGPNTDQINAFVAPELRTPEEAFYAATIIASDVFGAMIEAKKKKK